MSGRLAVPEDLAGRAARWRPPPLIANPAVRWALALAGLAWFVAAVASMEVNWVRVAEGWARGARFLASFLPPDFTSKSDDIAEGLLESVTMTVVSTVLGLTLSIPVALGAARNLAPPLVYGACRAVLVVTRTFQEVLVAILFVAMFGFGPLAGTLTLAFATIGFIGKLLAEDIEAIDPAPLEAVRASGASWWQSLAWGVLPQVKPRLLGLSLYRVDINFRESAVLGIVGAGGIGATLNTALDRYEFDTAAAILLLIIAIVVACEYASGIIRRAAL
jgi:phosphonate transport system permease protein